MAHKECDIVGKLNDAFKTTLFFRTGHLLFVFHNNIFFRQHQVSGRVFLILTTISVIISSPTSLQVLRNKLVFTKFYMYLCSAFLLVVFLNILFGRVDWEGYGIMLTFPITFLIALTISKHVETTEIDLYKTLVIVSSAHSAFLILVALLQVFFFKIPRAHGDINAINFAHLLTISGGITAIWFFQKVRKAPTIKHSVSLLSWLLILIFAVHITGTRGAIIVFFPFLLGLILINLKDSRLVAVRSIPILTIAVIFLTALIVGSDRFEVGLSQLAQTIDGQQYAGSVGFRLGMWAEAWKLILERPITGHGLLQFNDITSLPVANPIQHYNHVHNQFLDVWMKAGIGGLVFIVALLGLPVIVGIKLIIKGSAPGAGLSLIFLGGSFFTFGLTEVYLEQVDTSILLATYIPMLLLLADREMRTAD